MAQDRDIHASRVKYKHVTADIKILRAIHPTFRQLLNVLTPTVRMGLTIVATLIRHRPTQASQAGIGRCAKRCMQVQDRGRATHAIHALHAIAGISRK